MSNTNNNLQTQTSNALHNAIMEAGGKDRPPMLALDNYVQWKSRIKIYINTKPNNELIHYCLQNPPYKFKWTEKTVPVAKGSSETTTEGYMENYKNVSQDIRDQLNAEAEAVQIILTGIDNDIYSTVDACPNACEMWKAIEKFYKMMNELVRNQCDVTNHQVNVQFLLQLQLEWQRFVTLVKQSQELKTVSYHKLYDILKQHQTKVNEIRAERLARTANPLALVAQQQSVYHPQNHPTHYTHNSSTKSQQAATRNRCKAIVNSSTPTYDQEPTIVVEDDEMSKDKKIDKLMALISLSFKKIYKPTNNNLRTSSNTSRANQDNTPRINKGTGYDDLRVVNVAGAKENVEEAGFQLNSEQADWRDDTDDEPKDQELEAHYMYMAQIQEVTLDAADSDTNITIDSLDMCNNGETVDQDDDVLDKERDLLASLIEKLKCEIDDSKKRNKFLETSNKALVDKLEDLKKFQAKLDRYHDVNYASKINDLNQTISDMKKELFAHQETIFIMSQEKEAQIKYYKTREDKEIDRVIALENKVKVLVNIVYKTCQSVQTMNMLNRNCKTSFSKPEFFKKAQRANPHLYDIGCYNYNLALMLAPESDETIRLAKESRSKLSDLIRPFDYNQLNNLYDLFILQREKSPEQQYFLKESKMSHTSAKNENSKESFNKQLTLLEKRMDESILWDQKVYYYADHMNAILGVYTEMDEVTNLQCGYLEALKKCERLEKELSKSRTMSKSFEALQEHAINLELALQQYLKAQLQDKGIAISELKKLIEKMKGKPVETKVFNKRTRVIVETIHVNFDEFPQMASDHVSSDPVPQCPTTILEQDSLSPGPQSQEKVHQAAETVTTSNELDLLFSLMFDELLNGTTLVVSKSSAVHAADAHNKHQQHNTTQSSTTTVAAVAPPLNIQTTPQTTNQAPTQVPTVTANENII
ncbi:hypothetical protein Tco_1344460 [Tanacetum coccineum]